MSRAPASFGGVARLLVLPWAVVALVLLAQFVFWG